MCIRTGRRRVLNLSPGIDSLGGVQWELFGCLALAWVAVFLCFCRGVKSIGKGGIYVLQVMDWYCSTFTLMIIAFIECVVVSWFYGVNRIFADIELMVGCKPCIGWKFMWRFATPTIVLFIFVANIATHESVSYGTYKYPTWSIALGWFFACCSMFLIPLSAIVAVNQYKYLRIVERIKKLLVPTPEWGPTMSEHRQKYKETLDDEKKAEVKDYVYSLEAFLEEKDVFDPS